MLRSITSKRANFAAILLNFRRNLSVYSVNRYKRPQHNVYFKSQSHQLNSFNLLRRQLSNFQSVNDFHNITDETLEALSDFFDGLADSHRIPSPDDYDVNFGDGVLTIHFGGDVGTYVINKQTPNQQIWLSSPSSGPKRYDFINNQWIYKRDNVSLHELLSKELGAITGDKIDLTQL